MPTLKDDTLRCTREDAKNKLQQRIDLWKLVKDERLLTDFSEKSKFLDNYKDWDNYTLDLLSSLFTSNRNRAHYSNESTASILASRGLSERVDEAIKSGDAKVKFLTGLIGRLELYAEPAPAASATTRVPSAPSNRIFIIHGHDELLKVSLARLLTAIGLEPIILQEQPDHGRTIIEKFEGHSDVDFAIALFSPDDYGGPKGNLQDDRKRLRSGCVHQDRARENVLFETGYFFAQLNRRNVMILHRANVELPSDLSGIIFQPVDDGHAWKYKVAKCLFDKGYKVDLSKVV